MGEEVDVCVAVGGEHSYAAVFADEAVADGEGFLLLADVFEGVCCGGVYQVRYVGSQ